MFDFGKIYDVITSDSLVAARGLYIELASTTLWVDGDPHVLHTVLLNLLWNAVRYTPS